MLLKITDHYNKRIFIVETVILCLSLFIFNLLEMLYHDASLRIAISSIIIFTLFLPVTILLLTSKHTGKFKKAAGFIYIFLLISLIPRTIEGIVGKIVSLETSNYYQTFLFGSLILLMITNVIIYLLFMKEKTDNIVEKMACYDRLTDVMNRHNFFATGKYIFEKCQKLNDSLSLLFLDIDFFKSINDYYGHKFGDEVLVRFADMLKKSIRPSDICCRYGGEEFVVLTNVNEDECKSMAVRILSETENICIESQPDFHMTVSIGCVTEIPGTDETLEDFIDKADKVMYKSKQDGRNRITVHKDTPNCI
ncbi:MAG: GGDEF domain-containing protein [Azoarcus sp.]|jgi:diguanylate cyclase (GGDEF)-like protein|nr:GGDEF domain-containing protein [Azoarcus sp.]